MVETGKGGRGRGETPAPKGKADIPCAYCNRRQGVEHLKACLEFRLECLAGITREGIAVHQNGDLIYTNAPFAAMFGYSPEEISSVHFADLIDPEFRPILEQAAPADDPVSYEVTGLRKDGNRFPLAVSLRKIPLDGHSVRVAACRDLTRQKQHEQQIEAILESSDDQIVVVDRDYIHLYVNQAALDFVGKRREEVIGKRISETLAHLPEFMKMWIPRIDKVLQTGKPQRLEDEVQGMEKRIVLQSVLFPIRYPGGEIFAVGVISRDITEQKELQRQLEESEAKYRQLYIESPIALYRTRISDGKVLECNHAMVRLAGFDSREEFMEQVYASEYYVNPTERGELLERLKKEKRVEGYQFETRRKDGKGIWVELSAEIFPEEGYIEGTQRDITATKLLTKAEKKVVRLIHEGLSNKEIARRLNKSVRTIEDHRRNVMRKLSLDNIVDLLNQTKSVLAEQESR